MEQPESLDSLDEFARQCINADNYPDDYHIFKSYSCPSCKGSEFRITIEHHTGSKEWNFKGVIWGECMSCRYLARLFTFTGEHRKFLRDEHPVCECGNISFTTGQCERIEGETGRQNRYPAEFLGCTKGNLWFYSLQNGIHSLNTGTLEINVTQDSIFSINPEIKDKLATCEWYKLSQYFQFNDITKKVVLTDNQGYRYLMDTENLLAEKVTWEYRSFNPGADQCLKTNISYPPPDLNLSGELRKQIKVNRKEANPGLTFLDGKFIVDRDPERAAVRIDKQLSRHMLQTEELYPKIMSLKALNNGKGPQWNTPERDTLRTLEDSAREIEYEIRKLEECRNDIMVTGQSTSYNQLIIIWMLHVHCIDINDGTILWKFRV